MILLSWQSTTVAFTLSMTKAPLGVGVIGCGRIGRVHLETLGMCVCVCV